MYNVICHPSPSNGQHEQPTNSMKYVTPVTSGPSVASQSQESSTSSRKRQAVLYTLTVVFSGVTRGTTYTYTLVPLDANGDTIGTAINGTFMRSKSCM